CALLPVLGALLLPTLGGARWRLFFWTLPPLVGLAVANIAFYFAAAHGSPEAMRWAVEFGIDALAFLYSLYGGLLTPAFTRSYLRARGERAAAILVPLEYATALVMVAYAAADLLGAPPAWMAATALGACALHAWRALRWRGWRTAREPLLWTLHLGYAWFILALALRAAAALGAAVPGDAWIHAFTLGALGLTMASLMTRVALRHTGRALRVRPAMRVAYLAVLAAALLRLGYAERAFGEAAILASALLWGGSFLAYAALYGPMLAAPSLPRPAP
ncbi:MAG: NnrS family protein, partial [Betaproteobacteria bacterium]|nr:NnrS family protein [Betaproteobacteria bacterium]